MPNSTPSMDFQPKILIVSSHARARGPLIHGLLKDDVSRYGLVTVAINPGKSVAGGVLQILEEEGVSPKGIRTGPLGRAVNENMRLIVWVSETVQQESAVIAAPCEKLCFDLPDPAREIEEGKDPKKVFYNLRDRIKENVIPRIKQEINSP